MPPRGPFEAAHPTLVRVSSIGRSYEGREIWPPSMTMRPVPPRASFIGFPTGTAYPDALAGGPAAARLHVPLLAGRPRPTACSDIARLGRPRPGRLVVL